MGDVTKGRVFGQRFVVVPEWVLDLKVAPRSIVLYATLQRFADPQGRAFPGRRKLASMMRVSVDTIDRATKELVDADAVTVVPRFDDQGDQTSNDYIVHSVRSGGLTDAATGGGTSEATGGGTAAAQNQTHVEPDPSLTNGALVPRAAKVEVLRPRDLVFEATASACGIDYRELTPSARAQIGRAVKELKQVDATPEEIIRRSENWPALFDRATLTPLALAKHWAALGKVKPRREAQRRTNAWHNLKTIYPDMPDSEIDRLLRGEA